MKGIKIAKPPIRRSIEDQIQQAAREISKLYKAKNKPIKRITESLQEIF